MQQIIGGILIAFGVADFGLSWFGINLTPFLPPDIARFSPVAFMVVGGFFIDFRVFQNFASQKVLDFLDVSKPLIGSFSQFYITYKYFRISLYETDFAYMFLSVYD